jgi:hypothetical protein
MRIGGKICIIYSQLRDFPIFFLGESKNFQKFFRSTKIFFGQKTTCFMILKDKQNAKFQGF